MLKSLRHARSAKRVAMTPLIDIVFILLLFFILQTNFSAFRQLPLELPRSVEGAQHPGPRPVRLEVAATGRLWVDGETLQSVDALAALLERRQLPAQTPVVLAAAGAVPVQVLVDICDLLHARGIHGIDIRALEAH